MPRDNTAEDIEDEDLEEGQELEENQDDGEEEEPSDDSEDESEGEGQEDKAVDEGDEDSDKKEKDKERERLREARREEKQERKRLKNEAIARRRAKEESMKREIAELRTKVAAVTGSTQDVRLAGIYREAGELKMKYDMALTAKAQALESGDIKAYDAAIQLENTAKSRIVELAHQERDIKTSMQAPQPLNPVVKSMAEKWYSNHQWYKPDLSNLDSRIVNELSVDLLGEGFSAADPEYWSELDRRAAQYMPHRYKRNTRTAEDDDERPARGNQALPAKKKQVVGGSGNNSSGKDKSSGVKIPLDTVAAWKEAGIWDDQTKRAKAIKQYTEAMGLNQGDE